MEHRDIVQLKQNNSAEFDPEFQDKYIDSIAFLSRIAFANSVSLSPLLEAGIDKSYNKEFVEQFPDITIQIDTKDLDDIDVFEYIRGNPGVQATPANDQRQSVYGDQSPPEPIFSNMDTSAIEKYVRYHLELTEPDISLVDEDLSFTAGQTDPDIIGRDNENHIVLILIEDIVADSSPGAPADIIQKLHDMVKEYGGESHARGILITPETSAELDEIVNKFDFIKYISFTDILMQLQVTDDFPGNVRPSSD
jgi:hypothetical protein